jgi:hypothetical protein
MTAPAPARAAGLVRAHGAKGWWRRTGQRAAALSWPRRTSVRLAGAAASLPRLRHRSLLGEALEAVLSARAEWASPGRASWPDDGAAPYAGATRQRGGMGRHSAALRGGNGMPGHPVSGRAHGLVGTVGRGPRDPTRASVLLASAASRAGPETAGHAPDLPFPDVTQSHGLLAHTHPSRMGASGDAGPRRGAMDSPHRPAASPRGAVPAREGLSTRPGRDGLDDLGSPRGLADLAGRDGGRGRAGIVALNGPAPLLDVLVRHASRAAMHRYGAGTPQTGSSGPSPADRRQVMDWVTDAAPSLARTLAAAWMSRLDGRAAPPAILRDHSAGSQSPRTYGPGHVGESPAPGDMSRAGWPWSRPGAVERSVTGERATRGQPLPAASTTGHPHPAGPRDPGFFATHGSTAYDASSPSTRHRNAPGSPGDGTSTESTGLHGAAGTGATGDDPAGRAEGLRPGLRWDPGAGPPSASPEDWFPHLLAPLSGRLPWPATGPQPGPGSHLRAGAPSGAGTSGAGRAPTSPGFPMEAVPGWADPAREQERLDELAEDLRRILQQEARRHGIPG